MTANANLQKDYRAFANRFVTVFAPEIFEVYHYQVELYRSVQASMVVEKAEYPKFSLLHSHDVLWCMLFAPVDTPRVLSRNRPGFC